MASNNYSCEICGLEGMCEEEMRAHTRVAHVDGHGTCPFCGLTSVSPAELLVHVNQAHLDFLTPESELISFIDDDNSPVECNYSPEPGPCYINNINVVNNTRIVNGGGGQGSPLRTNLALQLQALQCPMCAHRCASPTRLQEHVNREHFDLTSPGVASSSTIDLPTCPLCGQFFTNATDLELHVNIEHRDVLSPTSPTICPVCGVELNNSNGEKHVESHFQNTRQEEQREFEMLRAQYGMDNQGNFREQSVTNMQRAVYAGEMSVSDYYEKQIDLRESESSGVDDGSSMTKNLCAAVTAAYATVYTGKIFTCSAIDHYAASYGDRGWGCGYRNTQMMISSLITHTGFNELLHNSVKNAPRSAVPSIGKLQSLIETAWALGFDLQGSEQLGCKLYNTRKWIGATEVVTLLSSLRIKCQLVDFHRPTAQDGTHPELFEWIWRYFSCAAQGDFLAPLYLQHQGHSRTVMGIEQSRDGTLVLLVLDPSHSPSQMAQLSDTSSAANALRLLRKTTAAMRARQYQLVAVVGTIDTDAQYQQSKVLRATRVPER